VRKMEVELGCAIFVMAFCAVPNSITSLSSAGLYFTPPKTTVNPAPSTVTTAAPDSSYGQAFAGVPTAADIPPWWYTVMGLSSGVNAAVKAGINTGVRDFRMVEQLANIATVEDPQLRAEIQRFYSECFIPARSRYLNAGVPSSEASAAIASHGQADVDWMGSHAFRDDPNLYAALYAEREVPGFALDFDRDKDMDGNPVVPVYGRPSCKEWWEDSANGLREKMASGVGKAEWLLKSKLGDLFPALSSDERSDQLAKLALRKSRPTYVDREKVIGDDRGLAETVMHAVTSDITSSAGILWKGFEASTTLYAMIQFLTLGQPLILMGVYMFLPLIVVFSRYSLKVMFLGGLTIFTIKFWSVMWFIARWLDDHLIEAMYPGADGSVLIEAVMTGLTGSIKRTTLNTLLLAMYAGFPLIWSSLMGWIGLNIGRGIENLQAGAVESAASAGKTGATLPAKVAKFIK